MSDYLYSPHECNVCLSEASAKIKQVRLVKPFADISTSPTPDTPAPVAKKCDGCKLVPYCSEEHKKKDWPSHGDFCGVAIRICQAYKVPHPYFISGKPSSKKMLEAATMQIKDLMRTTLKRSLLGHEEEVTSFPAHCAVCYELENVNACPRCKGVAYCSSAHVEKDAENHRAICGLLELYYCAYKLEPLQPHIITDFYKIVPELMKNDLMSVFQRATLKQLPANPTETLNAYQLFATAAGFSCIATICFALEFLDMSSFKHPKFVIFILGATVERDQWFQTIHAKFFFLQIPQITRLELYFIGPELFSEPGEKEETFMFQGISRTVLYGTYRCGYEDFAPDHFIQPSLIVAFNCGFSDYTCYQNSYTRTGKDKSALCSSNNPWAPAMKEMLITYQLPIIFTSNTEFEADFDYAALLLVAQTMKIPVKLTRLFKIQRNPYRDFRPMLNWRMIENEPIYYRNGYVQGVRSMLKQ